MYYGTALVRRSPLAEKVYARAAEIERIKREAVESRERAEREAREAEEEKVKFWMRYRWPQERISSAFRRRSTRDVLRVAGVYFGYGPNVLTGPTKPAELMIARQVAQYVAYNYCDASFPQIGAVFNRDHTTILSNVRKIQRLLDEGNAEIRKHVEAIRMELVSPEPGEFYFWGS